MAIIPTVRCSSMRKSLDFYGDILEFERIDGDETLDDPSFSILARGADRLILSSHRGDGGRWRALGGTSDGGRSTSI